MVYIITVTPSYPNLRSMINDASCTREIKSRITILQSSIQQEEGSFHQQIGHKFQEETIHMLHLEHSYVWCLKLDTSEDRSEIPGKF